MKYRHKYTYEPRWGHPKHDWTVIGRHGAVHFHVSDMGEDFEHGDRYGSGLECHYRVPREYMGDRAPGDERCWLIGGPCWHDGTSLYARETIVPFWLFDPHNHERMFRFLEREYENRFNIPAEDTQ